MTVRVIVAQSHAVIRSGLAVLLDEASTLKVVASASNGPALSELLNQQGADVVVIGLDLLRHEPELLEYATRGHCEVAFLALGAPRHPRELDWLLASAQLVGSNYQDPNLSNGVGNDGAGINWDNRVSSYQFLNC